jgi:peptide deformylase
VTRFDGSISRLADDLLENVLLPGRAGLAAPQIGVGLAAFSYNVDGQHGYLINPVVIEAGGVYDGSEGVYDGSEGCLSIPGITAWLRRPMRTVISGADRHGNPVTVEGTSELSRCLQHETDHLRGVLYIDRLTGQDRKEARRRLRPQHPAFTSERHARSAGQDGAEPGTPSVRVRA